MHPRRVPSVLRHLPGLLGLILLGLAVLPAAEGDIAVVIPASKPSRPAHFNWHFTSANGAAPQLGQFACGSWWVAPAPGDSGVVFVSLTGKPGQNDLLSCDDDPLTERHGLLSGKNNYGSYDANENLLPKLPQTFSPKAGSCISLVAAMQRNEDETSPGGTRQIKGEVVDAYCVVTVMPEAPKNGGADMIRPNITGTSKDFLTWEDFDLGRLPKHAFLNDKTAEEWISTQRRWSHSSEVFGMAAEKDSKWGRQFFKASEGGRAFRAALLIPDYAAGMARTFNGDVLALFADAPMTPEKKGALAAMLAFGLDIWHARYDYGTAARKGWSSGAGQSLGAFLPPVFAAALLRDDNKANRLRHAAIDNHGDDPGELGPQELRQITRGRTGVLLWGDGMPIRRKDNQTLVEHDWRYWGELVAAKCYDAYAGPGKPNPSQGQKTAADPYGYIDGPAVKPGSNYMGVTIGGFRSFAAAMILMPAVRSVVNSDAPIEYIDRLTRHGLWTAPDPVAPPALEDQDTAKLWWAAEKAPGWGKTYGPHLDDVTRAIEDGRGRFTKKNGQQMSKGGYESSQALNNWDTIIAMYHGAKYEDFAVDLGVVVAPEICFVPDDKPQAFLTCATREAQVHYTVDGSEPTADSPIYDGKPITVSATTQVRALATCDGMKPSAIRSASPPPPLR